jgi:glycosyltransferase involved in cell wall biosynthesis
MTERAAHHARLLFVTPDLRIGGAERHIATLLPALPKALFTSTVCCIDDGGPFVDDLRKGGISCSVLHQGSSGRAHLATSFVRLVRAMRTMRPDVVMTQGFRADVLGRLAARIARVPLTVTWRHNTGHVGRVGRRDRMTERVLGRFTHRYFGVCYGQVPYLTEYLGLPAAKTRIVHNGIDPALYGYEESRERLETRRELGISAAAPVISIVAVLREEKDHGSFLQAFSDVLRELPSCRALIIGDGPRRLYLESLARDLGISQSVHFLGNRPDVPALLAATDVVALTSYTVECFPYAILEAMAMARPSVVTEIAGLPELVVEGETGHLVPPHEPAVLARQLLAVLHSPDRGRSMGAAARTRLEANFTVALAAKRVSEEVLEALAEIRHRSGIALAEPQPTPVKSDAQIEAPFP